MVGGSVIEALPMRQSETGRPVVRLWCMDGADECCVYAEPYEIGNGPALGERIWWQSGRIYFDGDRRTTAKVGFSFGMPSC